MCESAFTLLAAPIQRILWQMGWNELRPIQAEAIPAILHGTGDLIISAQTASGKTEAAFLPILSRIFEARRDSVQAVYVSPLKALINDQFGRLEDLCKFAEIAVHRWHGDVPASKKRQLVERPSGILLITPESLESLFINRSSSLGRMFANLSFVVIDELHAFVGRERGLHLRSLLSRLEQRIGTTPWIIALSATLGPALPLYARWIRPDAAGQVKVIDDQASERRILYKIYGFQLPARKPIGSERGEPVVTTDDDCTPGFQAMVENMYNAFAGSTNLIFANRKDDVEVLADRLNERCQRDSRPAEFLVHHGSVSKEIREQTEELMRGRRPFTTLCSSTLELGIDIGSVHAVGQVGAPWSVNSLVQRLGRSGRRGDDASTMRLYLRQHENGPGASLVDRLFPDVLHAIALTELMLAKWLETPRVGERDLSTFVHQILSVLAETGGIVASELFERLVIRGAFRWMDQQTFVQVLRSLAGHDMVEQMAEGPLILGLAGQETVADYSFYSAFMSDEEYTVVCDGRQIGTLPALYVPPVGEHLLLAAKRWEVRELDSLRKEVLVAPAQGRKPPRFLGRGGEVQPEVRQKMREIALGDQQFAYLNEQSLQWLCQIRETARQAHLYRLDLVELGDNINLWFTWTGTRIHQTLLLMAKSVDLPADDLELAILFHAPVDEIQSRFQRLLSATPTAESLAARIAIKQTRKFDAFLTDELLTYGLADSAIDLAGALRVATLLIGNMCANDGK
ncbi:MAG TPA: DEAD/DEAH box helicase [Pirellulales bacterium]|jgi:ATP-dependent Lhr-like helicase|nr:DEAD/DEAH box helicase [Pirellulales bacterium]